MKFSNVALFAMVALSAPSVHGHLNGTRVDRELLKADKNLRRAPKELDGSPRFRKGEILVKGSPLDLPAGVKVIRYQEKSNISVVKVTRGREKAIVKKLKKKGIMAEENFEVFASGVNPNDSYVNLQWHFDKIQARDAWEHSTGEGIIVAVLDTGLALTGNDGIGCVTNQQYNAMSNNNNVYDGNGHGTHVSGTIAQRTGNGIGVAGLAYNACIMPVKVLGDDGSGSFDYIAEGIEWAVDNGAHVINMSLGTNAESGMTSDGGLMDQALEYAYSRNVIVVAASGNDSHGDNVSYPSSYPTVISVGATDLTNGRSWYSNYGTGLDIVAPGGDTGVDLDGDGYYDGVLQETVEGGTVAYKFYQGTSMACPHVAAACAMIISAGVASGPTDVKNVLQGTALNLGSSEIFGAGLIQVLDAVTFSNGGGATSPTTPPPTDPVTSPPTPPPTDPVTPPPTPDPTTMAPVPTPVPTTSPPTPSCLAVRGSTCGGSNPDCCPGLSCRMGMMGMRDQCK